MFPKFLRIAMAPEYYDNSTGIQVEVPYSRFVKQLEVIATALGFSFEIVFSPDGEYGSLQPDGNFTGVLGMVQNREADIAIGDIAMTEELSEAFLLSFPLTVTELTFVKKKPEYVPNVAVFLYPFTLAAWLWIIACVCILPFIFRCLLWQKQSPLNALTITVRPLVCQGTEFAPQKPREYVLLAFWIMGSTFLAYFYTAVLLSFVTFPSLEGIRTIEDLAKGIKDGKYQAISNGDAIYTSGFMRSSDPSVRVIGSSINETEGYSDFVYALEHYALEYYESNKKPVFIEVRNEILFYKEIYFISEDNFFPISVPLVMHKEFCCKSELDQGVHHIWASGILDKILSDTFFKYFLGDYESYRNNWESPSPLAPLEMGLLKGLFLFLVASHFSRLSD